MFMDIHIYICIHKQNWIDVHIETQRPRSKSPHQIDCGTCTQESLMTYVGPPFTIAKLVQITPTTIWFMIAITIVFMGFINKLTTGGPHIV